MIVIVSIIVDVSLKPAAEAAALQLAPGSVGESFIVRFSPTGEEPATKVGCQPNVTPASAEQILAMVEAPPFLGHAVAETVNDSDPLAQFMSLAALAGVQPIQPPRPA